MSSRNAGVISPAAHMSSPGVALLDHAVGMGDGLLNR